MPSPFPGMDPYLEDPRLWSGVHAALLAAFQSQLGPAVRPRYVVRIEERVYVADSDDTAWPIRYPDVKIVSVNPASPLVRSGGGGAITEPIVVPDLLSEEVRDRFLTVENVESGNVVTVVELFSPTNKTAGSQGRMEFLRKRRETLGSDSNWVEVDLLRAGVRTAVRATLPPSEYQVYISRAEEDGRIGNIWPIRIFDPLPTIGIPLKPGDSDARLDLQAALTQVYEAGSYDLSLNYRRPPRILLRDDLDQWSDNLLRMKGITSN